MPGNFLIDGVGRWMQRRKREKKLRLAAQWPITQAQINHWEILTADEDTATMGAPFQIEAGFHFTLNGEYYGGYLHSVAMGLHEAETKAMGDPSVNIRYNAVNPDETAVFAEDNSRTFPFPIISG